MNLDEAFKMAVQKYYEGYDNSETKKLHSGDYEYDYDKLDGIHSEMKKKKKRSYVRKIDVAETGGVNSGMDDGEAGIGDDFDDD